MKGWTSRHQALLDAMRADRIAPVLHAHLTDEGATVEAQAAHRLRDWIISLSDDPGWRHLELVYRSEHAFPDAWDTATEAGCSARTDHHNALVFERLAMSQLRRDDIERASWSWAHCLGAWSRCADSDYYRSLLDTLTRGSDASVVAQANRRVLEPAIESLARDLRDSLGLDAGRERTIDLEQASDVLELVRQLSDRRPDAPNSPVQHGAALMREYLDSARRDAVRKLGDGLEHCDLSQSPEIQITAPFDRLNRRFRALDITDDVAISVVDKTVQSAWKLRKLDRWGEPDVADAILAATRRFADQLGEALDAGRAMGRQSLAADYLVFRGERLDETEEREAVFERALSLCPGHRNASMMLSYVRLQQAHEILLKFALVPGAVGRLPRANERLRASILTAHSYVEDAARVFPSNDELPQYRRDVREAAADFGIDLDESS